MGKLCADDWKVGKRSQYSGKDYKTPFGSIVVGTQIARVTEPMDVRNAAQLSELSGVKLSIVAALLPAFRGKNDEDVVDELLTLSSVASELDENIATSVVSELLIDGRGDLAVTMLLQLANQCRRNRNHEESLCEQPVQHQPVPQEQGVTNDLSDVPEEQRATSDLADVPNAVSETETTGDNPFTRERSECDSDFDQLYEDFVRAAKGTS